MQREILKNLHDIQESIGINILLYILQIRS
jgi:hypothetical protein